MATIVRGVDSLESVVRRLTFVESVAGVGLGKYIFVAFRTQLHGLVGCLTVRIGQSRESLTVSCQEAAAKMSMNKFF